MFGVRWLAVAVATTALAAPAQAPPQFLAHIARLLTTNQYARAYASLNPADRRLVTLDTYVRCSRRHPIPGRLISVEVLRSWNERVVVVPGRPPVPSVATQLAIRVAASDLHHDVSVVATRHAIAERGHWTWILSPARLRFFSGSSCNVHQPNVRLEWTPQVAVSIDRTLSGGGDPTGS
jgi:hypothetical protein